MRDETAAWLQPMADEAQKRGIDPMPLTLASMELAEVNWVRFGQLLRDELGWDDTYPARPGSEDAAPHGLGKLHEAVVF